MTSAVVSQKESAPPSALKRLVQPNFQEHKKNVDEITSQIAKLKKELDQLKERISNNGSGNSKGSQLRKDLRAEIDKVKEEQSSHWATRNGLQEQLKNIQELIKRKTDDVKSSKDRLAFRSHAEVDRKIAEMETKVASGSLKLIEEKRVLSDISALRKQKKLIDSFGPHEESITRDKARADDIRKQLDALNPISDQYKEKMDDLFGKLRAMDAENKEAQSKTKGLYSQRDELQTKINKLYDERKSLHAEFSKKKEEWDTFQKLERARRALQMKEEREQREKQRKLDEIQKMKELAEVPAYENEINSCNALVSLLQSFLPKESSTEIEEVKSEEKPAADNKNLPKGVSGAVALKKKSDRLEEDNYFGGSANKKKSSQKTKEKEMKFDLAVMNQFMNLKIDIPTKTADIPKAIEGLNNKKQHYLENQAKATKENIQKAKEMEEKYLKSMEEKEENQENGNVVENGHGEKVEVTEAEEN